VADPGPIEPGLPRLTGRPFPSYRHVPGVTPHPRRHAGGHSRGLPEPREAPLPPEEWPRDEGYLFAVDLYNHGYWWECHEILEALWRAAGQQDSEGGPAPGDPPRSGGRPQGRAGRLRQCAGRQDHAEESFFQGLLQVSAANLKRVAGRREGAASLARKGLARLERFEGIYRGLDVAAFTGEVRAWIAGERDAPPPILLSLPDE